MLTNVDVPVACQPDEAAAFASRARALADGVPPVMRPEALKARGWTCLASEDELEGEAAARLARACAAAGLTSGWAVEVPWAADDRIPAAHRFSISARGFQTLSKDLYIGSCFVLGEAADGFAAASDGDLYWMLAGPRAFIESVAGGSADYALERFGRIARSYCPSLAGKRLTAVYEAALGATAPSAL